MIKSRSDRLNEYSTIVVDVFANILIKAFAKIKKCLGYLLPQVILRYLFNWI